LNGSDVGRACVPVCIILLTSFTTWRIGVKLSAWDVSIAFSLLIIVNRGVLAAPAIFSDLSIDCDSWKRVPRTELRVPVMSVAKRT
jgi:hypothetical protein